MHAVSNTVRILSTVNFPNHTEKVMELHSTLNHSVSRGLYRFRESSFIGSLKIVGSLTS